MPGTATSRRTRADAERNRTAIVAAARQVYAELGPDAPFDAIARRAGVANGTLYRHFANAKLLRDAIFATRLQEATTQLAGLEHEPDAGSALATYLRSVAAHPDASLVDLLGRPLKDGPLVPERTRVRRQVSALLRRAISEGSVRNDLTLTDIDVTVLALSQVGRTEWVRPRQRERFTELLLAGLLA